MEKENKLIEYWAHMLDESIEPTPPHKPSRTDYVQPESGAMTLDDLVEFIRLANSKGKNKSQICALVQTNDSLANEGAFIGGKINGVRQENGKCVMTLSPYVNGRRRKDLSVQAGEPLTLEQLDAALPDMDGNAQVIIRMKDPFGYGPHAGRVIDAPICAGKTTSNAWEGLFLYVDLSAVAQSEFDAQQINEVRHSMRGPAAARRDGGIDEIADMRNKLANGVVEFTFWKHGENGQGDVQRHAVGTTSEQIIPVAERRRLDPNYDENVASYERRAGFIIWFWDLEKTAVRCFNTNRFDEIINFEPTNRHIDLNVDRVGNIFIHRDVDAGMENARPLDDARIERINGEIAELVVNGDIGLGDIGAGNAAQVYMDVGVNHEPVLRIEIHKRGTENDPPYQLRLNELRRAIRERFGVNVKKVTVDGTFEY